MYKYAESFLAAGGSLIATLCVSSFHPALHLWGPSLRPSAPVGPTCVLRTKALLITTGAIVCFVIPSPDRSHSV
ncbi:hypothetical protein ACQKWADRAFT_283934 [Trichoderma austrokoningii]